MAILWHNGAEREKSRAGEVTMIDELELPLDQRGLTDRTYERLRDLILTRRLKPNEKLSVDRIAAGLGVSRTPVKDALNRLAGDGLVTISRRVGSFVRPLTAKDVDEIFDLRLLFELHAAQLFIRRVSPPDRRQLHACVAEMAACIEGDRYLAGEMERFLDADHALHRTLVAMAGNDRLLAMYDALNIHVQIARAYYVRELPNTRQGLEEHRRIVEAIDDENLAALEQTLRHHITTVRELVQRNVADAGGVL